MLFITALLFVRLIVFFVNFSSSLLFNAISMTKKCVFLHVKWMCVKRGITGKSRKPRNRRDDPLVFSSVHTLRLEVASLLMYFFFLDS